MTVSTGQRPVPSSTKALLTIYRVLLRSQMTRTRALGLVTLGALSIALTGLARTSDDVLNTATNLLAEYGLSVVAPICTLWVASSSIADLVEERLLVYLWLKPTSSWLVPSAAFLTTLTIMLPLVVAPLTIAAVVTGIDTLIFPTLAASMLAVAAYSGLFLALGSRFRRALSWGLLYILVWENAITRITDGTARISVRSYVISILNHPTNADISLANRSMATSIILPLVVALMGIAISSWVLSQSDID